jgi:hypothetical protein
VIRPELSRREAGVTLASRNGLSPVDMYRDFHQRAHGCPPEMSVEGTFQHLYTESGE